MKERDKYKKNEPPLASMRQMFLEISHRKVKNLSKIKSPFCRFSASFSRKYDVTDAIRQDNGKMKLQYLISLLFDLFGILQPVSRP